MRVGLHALLSRLSLVSDHEERRNCQSGLLALNVSVKNVLSCGAVSDLRLWAVSLLIRFYVLSTQGRIFTVPSAAGTNRSYLIRSRFTVPLMGVTFRPETAAGHFPAGGLWRRRSSCVDHALSKVCAHNRGRRVFDQSIGPTHCGQVASFRLQGEASSPTPNQNLSESSSVVSRLPTLLDPLPHSRALPIFMAVILWRTRRSSQDCA
ncbi:hypothetical protein C2E23DRAFT_398941 [Lenzites betulinus]|nr:hypothetical protein C2E23DRAFT_398941 [Lenzites betulinus]